MIFNMEEKVYKQMKLVPVKNPNYEQKEITEQLVDLVNRKPIIVRNRQCNIIGQTVPGTAVIVDDFICGDILSFCTDLRWYKWSNAGMIIHPHYKTIIRYTDIEYISIMEVK